MEKINEIWISLIKFFAFVRDFFSTPLFTLGERSMTIGTIIYLLIAFAILRFISVRIKALIISIFQKAHFEQELVASISMIVRFIILFIGSIIIIQSAGIDMSSLGFIAGALGVGIGFGLQNVTNNFISGIIIVFEKPIKVGDRIEVGEVSGDVMNISARATTILTNNNISIIVPNSEFISSKVINWSHNDRSISFIIPIGVSYREDPSVIKTILLDIASDNPNVLKKPEPIVLFSAFGDSSLDFELVVWTDTYTDKPRILKSEIYFSIFEKFKKEGIEIPFPQHDINIRSSINQTPSSFLADDDSIPV